MNGPVDIPGTVITVDDNLQENPSADYTSIQDAINAASAGDTVAIYPGTYNEAVTINKALTIYGPGAFVNPVAGGRSTGEAIIINTIPVTIAASNVLFVGFELTGFTTGINVPFSSFAAPDYILQTIVLYYNYLVSSTGTVGIFVEPGFLSGLDIRVNLIDINNTAITTAVGIELNSSSSYPLGTVSYFNVVIDSNDINIENGGTAIDAPAALTSYVINTLAMTCNRFQMGGVGEALNIGNIIDAEIGNNLFETAGGTLGVQQGSIFGNTFNGSSGITLLGTANSNPYPSKNVFLSYNLFTQNVTGSDFTIETGAESDSIDAILNSFEIPSVGASANLINNQGTGTLNANNNWWGTAAGPTGNPGTILGIVTTTPYLTSYTLTPTKQTQPTCWPLSTILNVSPGFWIYAQVFTALYQAVENGGIATVGNTLGLFGQFDPPSASVTAITDGIGTFITTDTTSVFAPYPNGTTENWQDNPSMNVLTIPAGSTIVRAYLFYSATQINSIQDVSGDINNPISFTNSAGTTVSLTPENVVSILAPTSGNVYYHVRIDVTQYISGSGEYTVGGVPGALGISNVTGAEINYAGWTIVVAYSNPSSPLRDLNIWDVFDIIYTGNTLALTLNDFTTILTGTPEAKLFLGAGHGQNYLDGDEMGIGASEASLQAISGPNNAVENFYQSQINDDNGLLSTTGTFGTSNQPFAAVGEATAIPATRDGWDKTAVQIDSYLQPSQTQAVLAYQTVQSIFFRSILHQKIYLELQT